MKGSKMSSDVISSRTYSEPSSERGFALDFKKSSRWQQHSDTALPAQAMQSLKHQDKLKAKYYGSRPCGGIARELKLHANDRISVQPKTSGNNHQLHYVKSHSRKDDELVRYMSDLPGYLQRMERSESVQDKALNVGVLDWSRLEKWRIAANDSSTSLTSSNLPSKITVQSASFPNAVHNNTLTHRRKQHASLSSSLNSSHKDHVSRAARPPIQNVSCFQDFEISSKTSVKGQKKVQRTTKPVGSNNSDAILEPGKREDVDQKSTSKVRSRSSNSRYDSVSTRSKVNMSACYSASEKRAGEKQGLEVKRKPLDQMITSSIRASSSQLRSHDVSPNSKEKIVADGKTKKGIEELRESFIDLSPQQQPSENENIVLLVPKKISTNCSLQEPRTPLDKDLNVTHRKSLSDVFSHVQVQSSERTSEILHSCPLISRKETDTEPHKLLHSAMVTQGSEMSADASPCSRKMPFRLSDDKISGESSGRTVKGSVIETLNTLDQETVEVMARKGRHPSPNRRFSFSLSRMSRSFSFKESSAVPQLSSTYITTKSGPVISEGSFLDNLNREKAAGQNRGRSSPLRRMLDPLLKSRSSRTLHSAENNSLKESLNSFKSKRFDATEPLKDEKHEPPRIKALLQLTIRNGVPLFRFVVGNNSNILAATMNKLSSPQKNDSGCDYTFYSIDEIKKKSGSWISQGSKEKSCGYVYNVIGRMKVNNSSISGSNGPNSICQIKVKESVLFGVNRSQADQASPWFMANRELAAVVVKMLNEISSLDLQQTDQNKNLMHECSSQRLPESQCSGNLGKTEHANRFTVVLPGGNHSLPNKGVPSPLIHRWRSGGSCDCGGWDVGCKLCILANGSQCSEIPRASKSCLMPDCFELFTEGANRQDQPIFSLAQVEKGTYSIEFCSSISSLQAFFISVTVISCQKPTDLLDVCNATGEKFRQEPRNSSNITKKIHTIPPGETHVKYTLSTHLSTFERV
ncbi:hypothetical protein SADUNF_Sadunf06G0072700 [Salix dunnii]|uniref:DUF3527 domain protein n=1 Tax=Salix dunnii TaxID=1413687 RepID=A0A835K1E9_9ROSI|nr:hypothetical protein SADUNF_Sadunf06G0072700 [Salix dunnii]